MKSRHTSIAARCGCASIRLNRRSRTSSARSNSTRRSKIPQPDGRAPCCWEFRRRSSERLINGTIHGGSEEPSITGSTIFRKEYNYDDFESSQKQSWQRYEPDQRYHESEYLGP